MIRLATSADLAAIKAFDNFAGDRALEIAEARMHVAEMAGDVAGYVSWLPRGFVGRNFVSYLCVEPGHRRRGLATALIRSAEQKIGPGRLFISTEEDNTAMLALLPREGWTLAGSVAGVNTSNRAEVFFYKDLPAA